MRVSRLYIPQPLQVGGSVQLDETRAHYLRSVLRLKQDHEVILFNGMGDEYFCRLDEVSRKTVSARVESRIERNVETPLKVILGIGVSRGDRMDWAIQKAVELGVASLTPLVTERCVIKFDEDKKQQRQAHWRGIIQHAAEQSGRTILPELADLADLPKWASEQTGLRLFLDPYADFSLADLRPEGETVTLLSGPEGGFSEAERESAESAGFIPAKLGGRILRTETAVLAALAAVQALWGDFR